MGGLSFCLAEVILKKNFFFIEENRGWGWGQWHGIKEDDD